MTKKFSNLHRRIFERALVCAAKAKKQKTLPQRDKAGTSMFVRPDLPEEVSQEREVDERREAREVEVTRDVD